MTRFLSGIYMFSLVLYTFLVELLSVHLAQGQLLNYQQVECRENRWTSALTTTSQKVHSDTDLCLYLLLIVRMLNSNSFGPFSKETLPI